VQDAASPRGVVWRRHRGRWPIGSSRSRFAGHEVDARHRGVPRLHGPQVGQGSSVCQRVAAWGTGAVETGQHVRDDWRRLGRTSRRWDGRRAPLVAGGGVRCRVLWFCHGPLYQTAPHQSLRRRPRQRDGGGAGQATSCGEAAVERRWRRCMRNWEGWGEGRTDLHDGGPARRGGVNVRGSFFRSVSFGLPG
jgi:hypothetical protein